MHPDRIDRSKPHVPPGARGHACADLLALCVGGKLTPTALYAFVEAQQGDGADLTHGQVLQQLPAGLKLTYEIEMRGDPRPGGRGTLERLTDMQRPSARPVDFVGHKSETEKPRRNLLGTVHAVVNFLRPSGRRREKDAPVPASAAATGATHESMAAAVDPGRTQASPLRRQQSNADIARQIARPTEAAIVDALSLVPAAHRRLLAAGFQKQARMNVPPNRMDIHQSHSPAALNAAIRELLLQRNIIQAHPDYPSTGGRETLLQEAELTHRHYETSGSRGASCDEACQCLLHDLISGGMDREHLYKVDVREDRGRTHAFLLYSPKRLHPSGSSCAWPLVVLDPWATRPQKLLRVNDRSELEALVSRQLDDVVFAGGVPGGHRSIHII